MYYFLNRWHAIKIEKKTKPWTEMGNSGGKNKRNDYLTIARTRLNSYIPSLNANIYRPFG